MRSRKTDEPLLGKRASLFTWLTPSERKALIVVALLVLLGFIVKTLRGV
ncbi:MAG: hypothetical protein PHO37_10950 [Kiritimatiellae bacterium]|nr:hypothetical protein [Kiritimatiellia bacterium]